MKLYYSPGASSLAIHIILEEIGKPYEVQKINFANQEQTSPWFTRINPKAKLPVLERDDGTILTQFPAIALWLAFFNSDKSIFPEDAEQRARCLELIDYTVSTVHMQGFTRIARPENFSSVYHDEVKQRGKEIFGSGLQWLDGVMKTRKYFLDTFSIADATLFYIEFWSAVRLNQALPPNLARHYALMKSRPAVQRVLEKEGLAP